ncbi:MAG: hypothetical protein EXS37_17510 [Opitutus sp.]|nr:hypothetical protein [Opitutus sp.]
MTGPLNFFVGTRRLDFGAEHEIGRFQVDYNSRHAQTHITMSHGDGGVLVNRITNVGWILNRTQSDLYPRFVQTEGRDITNPDNYRPAANGLSNVDNDYDQDVDELVANARSDPALWREDIYFREQVAFTGTRSVQETVTAGYVMRQGRVGRTGLLAGVRTEKTETESEGWVRARVASTAAQQLADPIGSAQRDYANNRRTLHGSYTKSFPSADLTQNLTRNVCARLSWSSSFGRPALTNAVPNETANDAEQTLTINNPSLLPQTAANWDATLDCYFEPVGNLSVTWFRKTIRDCIVADQFVDNVPSGAANGYNGENTGFTLRQSLHAGTATVQGWEFSYQQQFTFLPGLLKGLGALANFSIIETKGDFGGTTNLSTGQVAGFVPRTGNFSLSWRHRAISARILANYMSGYISNHSAASAGRNLYRFPRTATNAGFAYQVRPSLAFTCDVDNVTNAEQALYREIPDQVQSRSIPGTTVTLGVTGRF